MARILKTCKECNKPFSISDEEQKWLKDNGLEQFERCSQCRNKRRNGKPKIKKVEEFSVW